jgi:phage anti-repressor protein
MSDLILSNEAIDAREVHEKLGVKTRYDMWIGRMISKYTFIEGEDFRTFMGISKGGRKPIEYAVSIGMAKELCMIANTKAGRNVRRAYIKLEKLVTEKKVTRLAGKETRKSLTDCVKDSGENERMHGRGYSNFTKLAYKIAGIEYIKGDNFRDTLSASDLDRVKTIEKMMDALLSIGKQYGEIKETLSHIFTEKQQELT